MAEPHFPRQECPSSTADMPQVWCITVQHADDEGALGAGMAERGQGENESQSQSARDIEDRRGHIALIRSTACPVPGKQSRRRHLHSGTDRTDTPLQACKAVHRLLAYVASHRTTHRRVAGSGLAYPDVRRRMTGKHGIASDANAA